MGTFVNLRGASNLIETVNTGEALANEQGKFSTCAVREVVAGP